MEKKQIVLISFLALAIISGVIVWQFKYNTPERKVQKLEKTINDLKETSGYNACMKKVNDGLQKQKDCTALKVKEKGYNDGLDCVAEYENPICKKYERYNAEVNANNDCITLLDKGTSLTYLDCNKLLENK